MKRLESGKCLQVNYINTLNEDEWPVHIDLNNNILLTAGVGNSSYPSSVRIWDLSKNSKLIPNISMMERFMQQIYEFRKDHRGSCR